MLPSLASMRDEKDPPARKSTLAAVVCQSSEGAFHCLMSSGVVQAFQTCLIGAATFVSTVIFIVFSCCKFEVDNDYFSPQWPDVRSLADVSPQNCYHAKIDLKRLSRR